MARDLSRFVGIPYVDKGTDPARGLDCWQLVRTFYASELRTIIPDYMTFYNSALDHQSARLAIARGIEDWIPVDRPEFGDVLVFRILHAPWHTAVHVGDGNMLHTDRAHGSVIEPMSGLRWRHRLYGAYRWNS